MDEPYAWCKIWQHIFEILYTVYVHKKISVKGQLISKCLFGVFNSPKKERKQFNLGYHSSKVEFFWSFFGRIEDTVHSRFKKDFGSGQKVS